MTDLYYKAIFDDSEISEEIEKNFKNGEIKKLIPVAAYTKDFELIKKIHEYTIAKEEDFLLLDELIFYLAYFKQGLDLLEELYDFTKNSKLRLEIISSILEIDRKHGIELTKEYITSDDLNKISIGIFLIDNFEIEELKQELISLINRPMLEELKYQALFTLGKLKYEKIQPLLLKGVVNKNDKQLLYIESVKNYTDENTRKILKKEAKKLFQDKLIKLKLAHIIYSYDKEFSNSIFSKFINSKRLDIQGFTIELLADLRNDKFVPEINGIFKSENKFNKANAIMYFRKIKYSSKLNDFKEFYFSDKANKNMKSEIISFVAQIDKQKESLIEFFNKLPKEEGLALLKNKIDYELRQRKIQ